MFLKSIYSSDSSKQRMRLNKQITKIKQRLDDKVKSYNKVAQSLRCQQIVGTVTESCSWPWVTRGKFKQISYA